MAKDNKIKGRKSSGVSHGIVKKKKKNLCKLHFM